MTRDEVLRLAEENGIVIVGEAMVRFANLAYAAGAAAEREACLEVLQDFGAWGCDPNETSKAIRARGET